VFIVLIASVSSQMEERLRYWNGYLLFYERMEEARTPVSAKKSKVTMWKTPSDKTRQPSVYVFIINFISVVQKLLQPRVFSHCMPDVCDSWYIKKHLK